MLENEPSRAELRKTFRAMRNSLTEKEQQLAATGLLSRCLKWAPFRKASRIACYLSNDGELDTHKVIDYCWLNNIEITLPVLDPLTPGHLLFAVYQAQSAMHNNKYGIAEPQFEKKNLVELHNIDIIFTPLVAFDSSGNRLGMGGGYYDRTLATLSDHGKQPLIIGVAHDCQLIEKLPVQSWDIPLHGIVTPSQIFTF
ncbi:5-formyltetrahydrofolate cyclo-ligase [Flavobacterium sp. W21_SRS_FM6]|uniref:5-formyltetrahydrofolate cyclo-ligase n=1 Tax=Flavobacterium sp. W21_SRS_FM6 TaxID=3240268 RepID=UPI003F923724